MVSSIERSRKPVYSVVLQVILEPLQKMSQMKKLLFCLNCENRFLSVTQVPIPNPHCGNYGSSAVVSQHDYAEGDGHLRRRPITGFSTSIASCHRPSSVFPAHVGVNLEPTNYTALFSVMCSFTCWNKEVAHAVRRA